MSDPLSKQREMISDMQIADVQGEWDFGSMAPRNVVNQGVWLIGSDYHTGHTMFCVVRNLGLAKWPKTHKRARLTPKGRRYLRHCSMPILETPTKSSEE